MKRWIITSRQFSTNPLGRLSFIESNYLTCIINKENGTSLININILGFPQCLSFQFSVINIR